MTLDEVFPWWILLLRALILLFYCSFSIQGKIIESLLDRLEPSLSSNLCSVNSLGAPGISASFCANISLLSHRKLVSSSSYAWSNLALIIIVFEGSPVSRYVVFRGVSLWSCRAPILFNVIFMSACYIWLAESTTSNLCSGVGHWLWVALHPYRNRMIVLNLLGVRVLLWYMASSATSLGNEGSPCTWRGLVAQRLCGMMIQIRLLWTLCIQSCSSL